MDVIIKISVEYLLSIFEIHRIIEKNVIKLSIMMSLTVEISN